MPADRHERQQRHWRRTLRLTAVLTAVWFVVSFVVTYFARELNTVWFGWPLSFWMAAQGSLIVYVALVWFYSRTMDRLDREIGLSEDE
jgi:putative solute:sodium symporter small subunit